MTDAPRRVPLRPSWRIPLWAALALPAAAWVLRAWVVDDWRLDLPRDGIALGILVAAVVVTGFIRGWAAPAPDEYVAEEGEDIRGGS